MSDEPVRSKPYTIPYNTRESLKRYIRDMEKMGVIRESKSPYSSPVVIVRKKDGTNRVCVDFRKLNRITEFDPTPMPTAEDIFQKMSKAKYLTKLDLSKGYWQIPVAAKDIPKTVFVTPDGSYKFVKMPFGMMNSGVTLVRAIRKLLEDLDEADNYVDDIIIYTETWEQHLVVLDEVLSRLAKAGFTVRPTKCVLAADSIEVVGHRIPDGIKGLHEDNVAKIRHAKRPRMKKEVRAFLGLTGYYREFIPNYAAKAVPPLVYLKTAKFLNDRVMRWAIFLQNYSLKIESIKGVENVGTDYLSRAC